MIPNDDLGRACVSLEELEIHGVGGPSASLVLGGADDVPTETGWGTPR